MQNKVEMHQLDSVIVKTRSSDRLFNGLLIAGIACIMGLISLHQIVRVLEAGSDYSAHLQFWQYTRSTGNLIAPHALFPVLAYAIADVTKLPPVSGGLIVGVLANIVTPIAIYLFLRFTLPNSRRLLLLYAVLSLSLAIMYPITAFTWPNTYFGYFLPSVWHNPTYTIAKPFALPLILMVMAALAPISTSINGIGVGLLIIALLAIVAKPNYTLALLPAVVIMAALRWLKRSTVQWRRLWLGFIIPSLGALALQLLLVYGVGTDGSGVSLQPFAYMRYRLGENPLPLVIALVSSIAFPCLVYLGYSRQAHRDSLLMLAWLTTIVAILQYYLFVETGTRFSDGNWVWGVNAAIFVLNVISARFFIDQLFQRNQQGFGWRRFDWLIGLLFAVEVVLGVTRIGSPLP